MSKADSYQATIDRVLSYLGVVVDVTVHVGHYRSGRGNPDRQERHTGQVIGVGDRVDGRPGRSQTVVLYTADRRLLLVTVGRIVDIIPTVTVDTDDGR